MKKNSISMLLLTVYTLFFSGCYDEKNPPRYPQIQNEYNNSKLEKIKINVIKQNSDNVFLSKRSEYFILCVEGYQWLQSQRIDGSTSQMFVEDEKTGLSKPIKCTNF